MSTELNNVYLTSGGKLALAFGTSATKIYGSVDADTVTIAAGVTVVLDGSFNRGNDVIQFAGNAASYSIVKVNASTVKITDALGTSVTIPVGSTGTQIKFADADRVLSGSSAGLILGDQTVTSTAAALPAGTGGVDAYTLSVDSPSVTEGDSGSKTLSYKLTLDKAPTRDVTISYETLDLGTAKANDDFVPAVGAVTIAAGQRSAIVSITVLGDTVVEASETVVLRLSGSSLVSAVNATGTIIDNDQANLPVTYTLTGSNAVNEGSAAAFQLKTTGLAAGTTVGYKITGTGSALAKSGTGTFTIDSDGNATVSVAVSDNNTIGDTGALTIELLNGQASAVTATVIDGTPTTYSAPAISTTNSGSGVQTINVAGTAAQAITLDTDQLTANNGFVINSANAAVSVTSGASNDKITLTGNANNTIVTGAGNDTINISGSGNNTIRVGSGNDTVVGGSGNDTIYVDAGNLSVDDRIDGGAGDDTLVIAGDGNVINATNVKNIENIVLVGTTVTVTDLAGLANVKSISGHVDTSKVIVNVANDDVVDLTGISLTTIKSLTLNGSGTVTLKADAADLTTTGAILKTGTVTVNLVTDAAGYKAVTTADTGINGTKTVSDTVQNLIDNKTALNGVTQEVKGTVGLAESMQLADAGVTASKTVSMSVADLINASKYPDQKAALVAGTTKIQVTGTATAAQAADLITAYGTQITNYQGAATGNKGITIEDTAANIAGALTLNGSSLAASGANASQVTSIVIKSSAGVAVSDATKLAKLADTKVAGTYSVTDTASAISGTTQDPSLAKASSVSLTTATRELTSVSDALELKSLGSKLAGGYDLSLTGLVSGSLTSDELSAIAGAKAVTLSSTTKFSVSDLNTILDKNPAATLDKVTGTATNLSGVTAKLAQVTGDIYVTTAATVAEAVELKKAIDTLDAKNVGALDRTNANQNKYSIVDYKSAVLASSNDAVVKGAEAVTVSDALSLDEAKALQAMADASTTDRLATGAALDYKISEDASVLATAIAANNSAVNAALSGAKAATDGVVATGTATVAQAKVLGTSGNVDQYKIKDTVANLFSSGSTLKADIDSVDGTDAALSKATKLSVDGAITIAQMTALKGVKYNTNTSLIFDDVYAIKDTAAVVATAGNKAALEVATGITLTTDAAVANLATLKTLNDALAAAGKAKVSFALTDAIDTITTELNSTATGVSAFARTATSITATGSKTTITTAALDDLAKAAGSTGYSVTISDTAGNIKTLTASILANAAVTKLVISTDPLDVATAKGVITDIGSAATAKLVYNLEDSFTALSATADKSVVEGAVNLTATGTLKAAEAATLVGLTGAKGTVTYDLSDTYAKLEAQASSIADGAKSIDLTDATLNVTQYTNLLKWAKPTASDNTAVTKEVLKDTAAAVSGASNDVLTHADSVTLTDNASLVLSVAQAKALAVSSSAYKTITPPAGGGSLQVKIVDTTANLLAAAKGSDSKEGFVLDGGSYKVSNSDTVTLSVSDANYLRGKDNSDAALGKIKDASVTYNLADRSDNLIVSGAAVPAVAGAGTVTVTAIAGDATMAAEAKAIYDANKNVSFDVVTDGANALGASSGTGASKVYTYAATLAKAGQVVVGSAATVAAIAEVKAAAGSVAVKYDLLDTATLLTAGTAASSLAGATKIFVDTGSADATVAQALVLADYAAKLADDTSIKVTGTAADLKANAAAVASVAAGTGSITVTGGTLSADDFKTLKAAFGTELASATTITDTAANVANHIAGGTTAPNSYVFSGSKEVTVAQAKTLITANVDGNTATNLIVKGTAAELMTIADNSDVAAYKATDVVELSIAKDLEGRFAAKASFSIATTAERFARAYDSEVNNAGAQPDNDALDALKQATSLTVDGVTVTLGVKNASLTASSRTEYNGKIVGTVAELNALPASIKSAAGYVIVDSVANVTASGNVALVAGSAGYVVKDSAANLLAASSAVLSSGQKAIGIEVDGGTTYSDIVNLLNKTDVDSYVKYSLSDTAANLAGGNTALVDGATTISVSDVATVSQATAIVDGVTAAKVVKLAVSGTGSALVGMTSTHLAKVTAITVDDDASTAGQQGTSASNANTILTQATKATVSLNITDTAAALATAITNTGAGAKLATLQAAGTVSVTGGKDGTAATAGQAKQLAKITVTGGYAVYGEANDLLHADTVSISDLQKATVVKLDLIYKPTVQQAQKLVDLGNLEKGTGNDAAKYVMSIADSALNIAKYASAGLLDGITNASTVTVSSYTDVLTAAQAKTLAELDAASAKLSTTAASVKVTDTAANLLDAANATTIAAVGTINISDAVTVAKLNQVKTAGGTDAGEQYTYKLEDTASALITAGSSVVAGATTIKLTGTTAAGALDLIKSWTSGANVFVANSVAKVSDTAGELFSSGNLKANVADYAAVIDLTGSATVDQVGKLLADSNFDKQYVIADTASAIINAINKDTGLSLLKGADSVGLSPYQTASAAQAMMINDNLTNEAALALWDYAAELNLAVYASTVANASAVTVRGSTSNDGLAAGITSAKITYRVDGLENMADMDSGTSDGALDVINGKAGDVIDLNVISDWDVFEDGTQGTLVAAASASATDLTPGKYFVERGYYSNGSFTVSASGSDSRLLIETGGANTGGADEVIIILGVTSLTANSATDANTFTFG